MREHIANLCYSLAKSKLYHSVTKSTSLVFCYAEKLFTILPRRANLYYADARNTSLRFCRTRNSLLLLCCTSKMFTSLLQNEHVRTSLLLQGSNLESSAATSNFVTILNPPNPQHPPQIHQTRPGSARIRNVHDLQQNAPESANSNRIRQLTAPTRIHNNPATQPNPQQAPRISRELLDLPRDR